MIEAYRKLETCSQRGKMIKLCHNNSQYFLISSRLKARKLRKNKLQQRLRLLSQNLIKRGQGFKQRKKNKQLCQNRDKTNIKTHLEINTNSFL